MARILLYTDRDEIFGAEQINHEIACACTRAGHAVTIAQPRAENHLIDEQRRRGISHAWIASEDVHGQVATHRASAQAREAVDVFERTSPDIILFGDGCPVSSLQAKLCAVQRAIPYVCLVHCVDPAWSVTFAAWLDDVESAYRAASAVVSVSNDNLRRLRADFRLDGGKGTVVMQGRPDSFFAPRDAVVRRRIRRELGFDESTIVFATVGRYCESKGYQYQLQAMQRLIGSRSFACAGFLWVGSGYLEDRLRAMTRLLQIQEQVKITGRRTDIPDLLDAADVFVLPSRYEGMPLAVVEAMAKGLPVIATAVSGTPQALGGTGMLLSDPSQGDITEELVVALSRLLDNPDLRASLGAAAGRRALRHFRLDRMANTYLSILESSLGIAKSSDD